MENINTTCEYLKYLLAPLVSNKGSSKFVESGWRGLCY